MLFGLFGCKSNTSKDFVFEEFKVQIEKAGMKIDSVDETGLIYILQDELTLKVSLDNVRKNYKRDNDVTHISDLVKSLTAYSIELPKDWTTAKSGIYITLFPNDYDFQEFIHIKVTDEFSKGYVYRQENKLTWISKLDIEQWKISENDLAEAANMNINKLLEKAVVNFDTIEGRKLGMIETEDYTLKSSLLFATDMRKKIEDDFGFPFYAVIPVRDFCYIFSENDFDFFSAKIGHVVVDEYQKSGHPITTEILKFSEIGVKAIGKYPVE